MSNQDRSISERNGFELFFGVKVIAMNSHRLPGKKGRMIITLKPGSSIPPLIEKRTSSKRLNNTAIHFSKLLTRAHAMEP
ncbi:hypothetical protein IEQ34_025985 [Dendrobium chrysotoxum]|uniref:Ribosomal protein L14 n=1 Tax=Dendrobium chrysotoxum TaxID=161865 RepID=A0AAV7FNF0_DENCH|nr:hypothetical protein IEQ34_025985 [Dendrobium chrysotoxum]